MMKYKLIVSDYGETMVHTGEDIHINNVNSILEYQKQGGKFVIATGREWPSIKRKLSKNGMDKLDEMAIICCYGTLVITSKEERILFQQYLDLTIVCEIVSFCIINDIPYSLVTKDKTLVQSSIDLNDYVWKQYDNQITFTSHDEIFDFIKSNNLDILKIDILSIGNYNILEDYIEDKYKGYFKQFISDKGFAELVSIKAGKGAGVQFLRSFGNYSEDEIIVVGDAPNDLEMFLNSKNKVAVSNGCKEIMHNSTSVIDNSEYQGIKRLIEKILKGDKV